MLVAELASVAAGSPFRARPYSSALIIALYITERGSQTVRARSHFLTEVVVRASSPVPDAWSASVQRSLSTWGQR